jgi:hypothetical protein
MMKRQSTQHSTDGREFYLVMLFMLLLICLSTLQSLAQTPVLEWTYVRNAQMGLF